MNTKNNSRFRELFSWGGSLPAALAESAVTSRCWAVFLRASKADVDRATIELFAIQLVDSFLVVGVVFEFDETETFTTTTIAVSNNACAHDGADLLKMSFEAIVGCCVSEATDEQIL